MIEMVKKISKSKIFEVYETRGKFRRIYTVNSVPGTQVYGETLIEQDGVEYREWDAYKSKIGAAIVKGSPNIFIKRGNGVLYLGASTGTTVSHVSDIVGPEGVVFGVDHAPRVMRELVFVAQMRKNVIPVMESARHVDDLQRLVSMVDVCFQDIAQRDQVEIFLANVKRFVKKGGYGILALKARSVDVVKKPSVIFKQVTKQIERELTIVDYRELHPFQKDHAIYFCKKK